MPGSEHGRVSPSRKHSNVEPGSLEANVNVAEVLSACSVGPERISVTGGPSTVHAADAGVGSTLPAGSTARTSSTCSPAARPVSSYGVEQSPKPASSSWHSNVEPAWLAENANVTS